MNGELVYRRNGIEITIDLFEPDYGHELGREIVETWHGKIRRSDPVLFCEATGQPQPVYLREVRGRMYASHFDGSACNSHSPSPMSDEHKRQVDYVVRAASASGHSVETEVSLGTGVRPDVVIRGQQEVAIEVQRSGLTRRAALTRTAKAISAGLASSTWISDRDYPDRKPDWFWRVPSVGMNKQLWDAIPPRGAVTALGLREVYQARCALPDFPACPVTGRRPCGGWHVDHRPWMGVTVDQVAEMAPERGIVPLNWFGRHVLLVSPKSRALYEGATGRSADWQPTLRRPANRQHTRIDCARPIEYVPARAVAGPQPPPRPPIRPHVCVYCGKPATLYACGWRCDDHRPGAS